MSIRKSRADWKCPICSGKKVLQFEKYHGRSNLFRNKQLVTCALCTCKSIYPMISNDKLNDYNSNYWKNAQSDDKEARKYYYAQAVSRIGYIKLHLKELPRLEILILVLVMDLFLIC